MNRVEFMFIFCFLFLICIWFASRWEVFGLGLICGIILAISECKSSRNENEGKEIEKDKQIASRDYSQKISYQHTERVSNQKNRNIKYSNFEDKSSSVPERVTILNRKSFFSPPETKTNNSGKIEEQFNSPLPEDNSSRAGEAEMNLKTVSSFFSTSETYAHSLQCQDISSSVPESEIILNWTSSILSISENIKDINSVKREDQLNAPCFIDNIIISEEIAIQNEIIKSTIKVVNQIENDPNAFLKEVKADNPLIEPKKSTITLTTTDDDQIFILPGLVSLESNTAGEDISNIIISEELCIQNKIINSTMKIVNTIESDHNSFVKDIPFKVEDPKTENIKSAKTLTSTNKYQKFSNFPKIISSDTEKDYIQKENYPESFNETPCEPEFLGAGSVRTSGNTEEICWPPVPETSTVKTPNSKFQNFKTRLLCFRFYKKSRTGNGASRRDFKHCGDKPVLIKDEHDDMKKKLSFRCWSCIPCN